MGMYSSPEVTGITLHCPGVCGGDPEKSITEAAESLVDRLTDVCKSERTVKRVTIRVEFE